MSSDNEQIDYDISFTRDNRVVIEAEGCSITSEYFEDKSIKRQTMNPAKLLYASFAL